MIMISCNILAAPAGLEPVPRESKSRVLTVLHHGAVCFFQKQINPYHELPGLLNAETPLVSLRCLSASFCVVAPFFRLVPIGCDTDLSAVRAICGSAYTPARECVIPLCRIHTDLPILVCTLYIILPLRLTPV